MAGTGFRKLMAYTLFLGESRVAERSLYVENNQLDLFIHFDTITACDRDRQTPGHTALYTCFVQ